MGMREEVLENILTDNSKVPKHGSGVGVINVHSRIRLMFGEEYGLSIESEPDEGTRVTIRIPAIPYTPENTRSIGITKIHTEETGRMKKNRMKFLIIEFLLLLLAVFFVWKIFRSERSRAPDCGDSSGVR